MVGLNLLETTPRNEMLCGEAFLESELTVQPLFLPCRFNRQCRTNGCETAVLLLFFLSDLVVSVCHHWYWKRSRRVNPTSDCPSKYLSSPSYG